MADQASEVQRDAAALRASLTPLPEPWVRPVFVLVSGLPGTGKSYFSRRLAEETSIIVLETDVLRRVLAPQPTYSGEESNRLFQAVHELLGDLLAQRLPVILDATNLVERHREVLYGIADANEALLIIVRTETPTETVRQRLDQRTRGGDPGDNSEAGLLVYERMRPSQERIGRNYIRVDTSEDISPAIRKIRRQIARWNRV